MQILTFFLKNAKVFAGASFLVLIGLLWIIGRKYLTTTVCFLLTIGILIIWMLVLIIQNIRAAKSSAFIEQSLKTQADQQINSARPDHREEIEAFKEQLIQGIDKLKSTKLGKKALYAIPWYMIIGPSACGKSMLIRHSGLEFPLLSRSGRGLKGVGGTRNCDWWFSSEAIILDTAGRYTTEEEDKEEWLAFLEFLRKARKRKPINGIIIAISIEDMIGKTHDEIEDHAKIIRDRINQLIVKFEIEFPIYLLFTKCDLLNGFVDSFNELSRAGRAQVFGCTYSKAQQENKFPGRVFEDEFTRIYLSLKSFMISRLATEKKEESLRNIYLFPLQFASVKNNLALFIDYLFKEDPYTQKPNMRGFYFTSGTQEGMPFDNVINVLGEKFGFPAEEISGFTDEMEKKSYFIKDLFYKIIFPDQDLAGRTKRFYNLYKYVVPGIAGILLLSFIIWKSISYNNDKALINSIRMTAEQVAELNNHPLDMDTGLIDDNLRELQNMHNHLMEIERRYSLKKQLFEPAFELYYEKLKPILITPLQIELKKELNARSEIALNNGEYHHMLRIYKLMGHHHSVPDDKKEREGIGIENTILNLLKQQSSYAGLIRSRPQLFNVHISYYSKLLYEQSNPDLPIDENIVKQGETFLQSTQPLDRIYLSLINDISTEVEPITISKNLGNQMILKGERSVQGVFTIKAWDKYVKNAIENVKTDRKIDWVTGQVAGEMPDEYQDNSQIIDDIKNQYYGEYINHWWDFLKNTSFEKYHSLKDATYQFEELIDEKQSPLIKLLKLVEKNTRFEKLTNLAKEISNRAIKPKHMVDRSFYGLHYLLQASGDSNDETPINTYMLSLKNIYNQLVTLNSGGDSRKEAIACAKEILRNGADLERTNHVINRLLKNFDFTSKEILGNLLKQPLENVLPVILAEASIGINEQWRQEINEEYMTLTRYFPFNPNSHNGVPLEQLEGFFSRPGGGKFWLFCESNLNGFARDYRNINEWENHGIKFTDEFWFFWAKARQISEAIANTPISFELIPKPLPYPPITRSKLEIGAQEPLTYENTTPRRHMFQWMGRKSEEICLTIYTGQGVIFGRPLEAPYSNWALFMLINQADTNKRKENILAWQFSSHGTNVEIKYGISVNTYPNPFKPDFFSLSFPTKICKENYD